MRSVFVNMATGSAKAMQMKVMGVADDAEDSVTSHSSEIESESIPLTTGSEHTKKYGCVPGRKPPKSGIKNYLQYWRDKHGTSFSCLQFWEKKRLQFWGKKREQRPRTIYFNNRALNSSGVHYCSNKISTTKYNIITFLPRFLFDQFRRYANLFFLVIALLQQIPGISPTGRFTTIVPLTLVLLAIAAKEIIEDLRRWRADNNENYSKIYVLRDNQFVSVKWKKVVVGDIVKVLNHQFFPADLLLLSSREPQGICYVQTSNLDGETNLKIRQAHQETMDKRTEVEMWQLSGHVECEGPNNRLYEFTGNIKVTEKPDPEPILPDQILLRGSQLRNTEWITGLVIYTGHDTKLLQNSTQAPLKRSRMDTVTNRQVIFLVCILLCLSFISSLGSVIWNSIHGKQQNHWYLYLSVNNLNVVASNFFLSILTFIILYNNLIPISLLVTLELLKFIQSFFINWDIDMYDTTSDTPALARNSNLNEELGQVKYVFADKTGTLTRNVMEFKKCSVDGQVYSMDTSSSSDGRYDILSLKETVQTLLSESTPNVLEFLKVLSLCHTVIPEEENDEIQFRASSPDEEALVKATMSLGIKCKTRTPDTIVLDVFGTAEVYKILNLLEFNSDRKRMSVIVRTPDGTIKLLCKGADSAIYPRLMTTDSIVTVTEKHLKYFALDGLRTLCVAQSIIKEEDYQEWNKIHYKAGISLENRERELDNAAEMIEKNLSLLGATAVEDKLQVGVPESIATLRDANIKVWVLTGDKQETAINIGFSSKQLTSDMKLMVINDKSLKEVKGHLRQLIEEEGFSDISAVKNAALIIDGKALGFALKTDAKSLLLKVALRCKSVICCRVSPLQKAQVVRLVRSEVKDSITLAIGDGANDVSMIQAAHVGVGISGKEGRQATLASDYAISQFRFLVKLLLVHGVWNYNRLAKIILFSFYKNICLYMIEFWFAFMNGFSGQPLFERWIIALFNVLFTFLSTITFGLFEQDTSAIARMEVPSLYKLSQQGEYFNSKIFWKWVTLSIYHSLLIFFFVTLALWKEMPLGNGQIVGLWYVGNTVYTCVVITVNLKLALESQYWTWLHHIAVWGSILMWFLFVAVYSHFWPHFHIAYEMVGQDAALYGSLSFYALFLLVPTLTMLPDLLLTVFQQSFWKSEVEHVRQEELKFMKKGKANYYRFGTHPVSFARRKGDAEYGDGLEGPLTSSLNYDLPSHGYAFSQEDHGVTKKGSRLQRRDMIRMDMSKKREHS